MCSKNELDTMPSCWLWTDPPDWINSHPTNANIMCKVCLFFHDVFSPSDLFRVAATLRACRMSSCHLNEEVDWDLPVEERSWPGDPPCEVDQVGLTKAPLPEAPGKNPVRSETDRIEASWHSFPEHPHRHRSLSHRRHQPEGFILAAARLSSRTGTEHRTNERHKHPSLERPHLCKYMYTSRKSTERVANLWFQFQGCCSKLFWTSAI